VFEFSNVVDVDEKLVAISFLELVEMMRLGLLQLDLTYSKHTHTRTHAHTHTHTHTHIHAQYM